MTTDRALNVLFLRTHNSARSVLADCVMMRLGVGSFKGDSAGSMPSGHVNPMALKQRLDENGRMEGSTLGAAS